MSIMTIVTLGAVLVLLIIIVAVIFILRRKKSKKREKRMSAAYDGENSRLMHIKSNGKFVHEILIPWFVRKFCHLYNNVLKIHNNHSGGVCFCLI